MEKKIGFILGLLKTAGENDSFNYLANEIRDGLTGPVLISGTKVSDGLRYHIDNNIPLTNPIYRKFSKEFFNLLKEAKELHESGELIICADSEWMLQGNFCQFAEFNGEQVPLDCPMELENEEFILKSAAEYKGKKVPVGKPRPIRKGEPGHGTKRFVVYVKDGDRVKRIAFGDPNLKAKPNKAKNRKSFRARHKCDQKKDKTTPGYWACRYPPNW